MGLAVTNMEKESKDNDVYKAKIALTTGGNYGYTFRIMPKHEMILDCQNLNLIKNYKFVCILSHVTAK